MKIDIAEVPNIRNLLDKLLLDQHNAANVEQSPAELFRVVEEGGIHAGELSKAELLGVFQARIDAGVKTLNTRYYIELKRPTDSSPVIAVPAAATGEGAPA